jgi:predicted peptidase
MVDSLFQFRQFISGPDTLPYRIMYPESFDSSKKYPVILFLHGRGESGSDNINQLVHGAAFFVSPQNRANFPAIVVFPQCSVSDYWANVNRIELPEGGLHFEFFPNKNPTNAMRLVMELMNQLRREKSTDKKRMYLGGLSMGGMGAYEILHRQPKWFAAAFSICGAGNPIFVKRFAKKTPMWAFHGQDDDVVQISLHTPMIQALEKHGAKPKFTVFPGVGHSSWDNAFQEKELLPWLFSHKK